MEKTMEKEVLIHVKGLTYDGHTRSDEPIEIVVPGEYYFRNGSHYLRYEEMLGRAGRSYGKLYQDILRGEWKYRKKDR